MRNPRLKWLSAVCVAAMLPLTLAAGSGIAEERNDTDIRVQSFSGAFLAARTAEYDNDLEASVRFFRKALAFDPSNQQLQRSLMLALVANEQFDEALPLAEKLKTVPEVERFSRLALAIDSFRNKEYGDAEYWLHLALESDLDRLISGVMIAWAKQGQGHTEEALDQIARLEGPQWFKLFKDYHRGLIAEQAGLNDIAREAFRATVVNRSGGSSAPDTYWRAVRAEARFLARVGDNEGALEALNQGEVFAPRRPELRALYKEIQQGATIGPMVADPGDGAAEILLNIGAALNRGGGEAFVRLYLQYARALRPESDAILVQLGHVAEQQERSEEAISFYERVPKDSPLKRIAEMQLGLNLADIDQHEEAVERLKALVEDDPTDMRAYLALGGVYGSQKDYEEAAKLYDRAVGQLGKPDPEDWRIFYQRGIAYERLKQWAKAEPNFKKALELQPDQPQVLNYLGYSWVDMNLNLDEGLDMIQRAVKLRPNDGYIVDSLGWAYFRLGRFEDAVRELERAVSLKPDDPILNDHLGDAYWRAGRKLQAVYQWNHSRDMEPELEVLAQVEHKLAEGLPPLETGTDKKVAMVQRVTLNDANDSEPADDVRFHTVSSGQSLWEIAADKLGSGQRLKEIIELNPELADNPDRIYPGQKLRLPPPKP